MAGPLRITCVHLGGEGPRAWDPELGFCEANFVARNLWCVSWSANRRRCAAHDWRAPSASRCGRSVIRANGPRQSWRHARAKRYALCLAASVGTFQSAKGRRSAKLWIPTADGLLLTRCGVVGRRPGRRGGTTVPAPGGTRRRRRRMRGGRGWATDGATIAARACMRAAMVAPSASKLILVGNFEKIPRLR